MYYLLLMISQKSNFSTKIETYFYLFIIKHFISITKKKEIKFNIVHELLNFKRNKKKENKITLNKKEINYKIKNIPSTDNQHNNHNSQQVER